LHDKQKKSEQIRCNRAKMCPEEAIFPYEYDEILIMA